MVLKVLLGPGMISISQGMRITINTGKDGVKLEIPKGYDGRIRSRDGLLERYGVTMLRSPVTIEPCCSGDIEIEVAHGTNE